VDILDALNILNEKKSSRYPSGRGKYQTKGKSGNLAIKSRVKVYSTIKAALKSHGPGHIFSTKGSRRLYVVSKRTHGGKDSESVVSGRIAKGFTPGSATPSADWGSVKDHAARVGHKYGGKKAKKLSAKSRREARKGKKYKRKTRKARGQK
jgi:hypothetical protein